jgi:ABC-type transport system involved in multi-copper enzyme maturation permease subunit
MPVRWGTGPVFAMELRAAARRWQTFAVRAGFVLALLIAFGISWKMHVGDKVNLTINDMARAGETFYYGLVGTQLSLLLLTAPAATAGAVCVDKARGCLLHLLMTDLSNGEIVLGKLAARLTPVFSLLLAGLPVLGAATLAGGIEPWTVFGETLVCAGVAVFGCSLALAFSVWAGKTHEVLVAAYAVEATALLACPLWLIGAKICFGPAGASPPIWVRKSNPFWLAFAPYTAPFSSTLVDALLFFAGSVGLSAVLVLAAVVTVRRSVVRYGAVIARPKRERRPTRWHRWLPAPSLDRNPVLWREWRRRQPSRWLRVVSSVLRVTAVSASIFVAGLAFSSYRLGDLVGVVNGLIVMIGLLLFSVSAVTSLSEERVRGSLDVLLTTPLSTFSIVVGKWWGTFRTVPLLALLVILNTAIPLLRPDRSGTVRVLGTGLPPPGRTHAAILVVEAVLLTLAFGAALTSIGLALATRIRRLGRASAVCTGVYVAMTVGPVLAAILLVDRRENQWVLLASPFWGVGILSGAVTAQFERPFMGELMRSAFDWILFYAAVAIALFVWTLVTFDRYMGRVRKRRPVGNGQTSVFQRPIAQDELAAAESGPTG